MLKGSKSLTRTRKQRNIEAICPVCGTSFLRSQVEIDSDKCVTCSRKCGYEFRSQRTGPRTFNVESQTKRCARCERWLPVDDFAVATGGHIGPHKRQAYCRWCGAEKSFEWKVANPEAKKQHKRMAYWKDVEKSRARGRVENWTEHQRLVKNEGARKYRKTHRDAIRLLNRTRRLTESALEGKISPAVVKLLLDLQQGRCAVCERDVTESGYHVDHRMPISKGGTNEFSNLQILCGSCNTSKSGRDPIEFMQSRGFLL